MLQLSDEDLLLRLQDFEDSFVERKTSSDSKDWLPTVVALANSTPVGYPAVLFIGVRNDGTIQETVNLDKLQQTFSKLVSEAYPPIATFPKVLRKEGKQFLVVIVPGSLERPHFAAHSYVRVGSETRKASEAQFAELIARRNRKANEILKWKGKLITISFIRRDGLQSTKELRVTDCNQFHVTLEDQYAHPLGRVEISSDFRKSRLKLEIRVD